MKTKDICPVCKQMTTITITTDGNWDIWKCNANGCEKHYQIIKYGDGD